MPKTPAMPEWMERTAQALAVLKSDAALAAAVRAEVDAFLAEHPSEPDTPATRDLLTGIVFRRLTSGNADQENQQKEQAA